MKKKCYFIYFIILVFILSGCQKKSVVNEPITHTSFAMGTTVTESIYGGDEKLTSDIIDALKDAENSTLSWRVENSEIAKLNQSAGKGEYTGLSEKTMGYLKTIFQFAKDSQGAFDPTIGKITRLWDIGGDNPRVPADSEIQPLLKNVGYDKAKIDEKGVELPENVSVDLGAVGKGLGCDIAKDQIQKNATVEGAVIAVGGSILTYGQKPDKTSWNVAIADPRSESQDICATLKLDGEQYISTSGDYEKFIIQNGKRYHHIMDPKTGYPSESGLISVTIVCNNGLLSDGLSTACFVLGKEKSLPLLQKYKAEAVFIDETKKVSVTDGLKDKLTILKQDYQLSE